MMIFQISIGFIGYPNVGKSSVINTLKSKAVCKVAPIPGETKVSKIHFRWVILTHTFAGLAIHYAIQKDFFDRLPRSRTGHVGFRSRDRVKGGIIFYCCGSLLN
jgi:hypothetical protein